MIIVDHALGYRKFPKTMNKPECFINPHLAGRCVTEAVARLRVGWRCGEGHTVECALAGNTLGVYDSGEHEDNS